MKTIVNRSSAAVENESSARKSSADQTSANEISAEESESNDQENQINNDSDKDFFALCCVCDLECGGAHKCSLCKKAVHVICGNIQDEEEGFGASVICNRCEKVNQFEKIRNDVVKNTSQQAKKMLKRSDKKFPEVNTHDNVVVPIPSVDRTKCEFQNLVAIILGKEDDFYVVGCRAGWIKEKFGRNGFQK